MELGTMKPTEQEKLQFGIEIVAAMFAERLHNGDLDAGMIDALSETELDRLGYSKEDLDAMPADRLEAIKKMVSFHKTRLHQQAMFMANTVLASGLISQMQPEWVACADRLPGQTQYTYEVCDIDDTEEEWYMKASWSAVRKLYEKGRITHYKLYVKPQPPTK